MKNNIFLFINLILTTFLLNCSDVSENKYLNTNAINKSSSVLGSKCNEGCIWSSWAVSSGVQNLTHYCDGQACACVVDGDIYSSCQNISYETERSQSLDQSNSVTQSVSSTYNPYKGNLISEEAYYEASKRNTVGWCYNAVADAVERITGRFLWGQHAYQAADQFANNENFYEIYNYDLNSLPKGAIVVWGKGSSRSGHISVSLGNGQEASDHIARQMTYHYGGAPSRVFYPR